MRPARGTLLIVDDDVSVVHTFARMLKLEGFEVLTACDAATAWQQIATTPTAAILLDLRMPLAGGVTLLRRLRAHECGYTPVAIITGDYFIDETVSSALRELGAIVCFKPLFVEDLVAIVECLLRPVQ